MDLVHQQLSYMNEDENIHFKNEAEHTLFLVLL